jgi:hypothetical protein
MLGRSHGERPAELDRAIAKAQPAAFVDPGCDRTGPVVKGLDLSRKATNPERSLRLINIVSIKPYNP